MRILVVEDWPDTAQTTRFLLRLWGYHCDVAGDGPAALRAARQEPPDVVLLDLGLPGMDGLAVARQLRADPATATALLVAVTGYGQEHEVERCLQAGFDRHFLKPVDLEALRPLLDEQATRSRPAGRHPLCTLVPGVSEREGGAP
jgi:CheY-like chemotaxis protein